MFNKQLHVLKYNGYINKHSCGMMQKYFLYNQGILKTPLPLVQVF